MFPLYPFNPFIPIGQRNQIKRIDVGGIYELKTNAQQVTDASVDYGINPCYYNALPCECIVLLKIHQGVAAASATLPVTIVTPNSGSTTVNGTANTSGTASGTTKVPVVDHAGNTVTGASVSETTEALAYINRRAVLSDCLGFSSLQAANRVLTMGQIEKSVPLKEKENVSRTKTVFSLLHLRQGRRKADSKNRSSNIGQQSSAEIS